MDANLLNLLVQIPIVGIFVWFALEMAKRQEKIQASFLTALDKRDEAFEMRNRAVCIQLDAMLNFLQSHDDRARNIANTTTAIKDQMDRDTGQRRRKTDG